MLDILSLLNVEFPQDKATLLVLPRGSVAVVSAAGIRAVSHLSCSAAVLQDPGSRRDTRLGSSSWVAISVMQNAHDWMVSWWVGWWVGLAQPCHQRGNEGDDNTSGTCSKY